MYAWGNVPPKFLEREIAPHSELAIWHLTISPRLQIRSAEVEQLGEGSWLVRVVLENTGWLPTSVSERPERKAVRPLEAEITPPEGGRVVGGEKKVELGQLDGRVHRRSLLWWASNDATSDRAKAEWVVEVPAGQLLRWRPATRRAGTVRRELSSSSRDGFRSAQAGAVFALPTFLLAVSFGVLARTLGLGVVAPIVFSSVVFSGSAQFAVADVLGAGGARWLRSSPRFSSPPGLR